MKNNIIGLIVYLVIAVIISPSMALLFMFIKENSDRCHYYGGKWSYADLCIGCAASVVGGVVRYFFPQIVLSV